MKNICIKLKPYIVNFTIFYIAIFIIIWLFSWNISESNSKIDCAQNNYYWYSKGNYCILFQE